MKTLRLFFAAAILLAFGVWLLAVHTQGDAGLAAGDSISAFSLKLNMTTTGYPAIFGVPAVLLGSILLFVASIATVVIEIRGALSRKRAIADKPKEISVETEQRPPL